MSSMTTLQPTARFLATVSNHISSDFYFSVYTRLAQCFEQIATKDADRNASPKAMSEFLKFIDTYTRLQSRVQFTFLEDSDFPAFALPLATVATLARRYATGYKRFGYFKAVSERWRLEDVHFLIPAAMTRLNDRYDAYRLGQIDMSPGDQDKLLKMTPALRKAYVAIELGGVLHGIKHEDMKYLCGH